jgi:hypothetical protein
MIKKQHKHKQNMLKVGTVCDKIIQFITSRSQYFQFQLLEFNRNIALDNHCNIFDAIIMTRHFEKFVVYFGSNYFLNFNRNIILPS